MSPNLAPAQRILYPRYDHRQAHALELKSRELPAAAAAPSARQAPTYGVSGDRSRTAERRPPPRYRSVNA